MANKRLKRRFGKDNERPIYQKYNSKYAEAYDRIFKKDKQDEKDIKENSTTDN